MNKKKDKEMKIKIENEIDDDSDVKRHILETHNHALKEVLSNDLILAVLTDKEKKFITDNVQAAFEARNRIVDKNEAEYACNRLLLSAHTVAILNRNVAGNPIISSVLEPAAIDPRDQERDIDAELMEKLKKKERGDKK